MISRGLHESLGVASFNPYLRPTGYGFRENYMLYNLKLLKLFIWVVYCLKLGLYRLFWKMSVAFFPSEGKSSWIPYR